MNALLSFFCDTGSGDVIVYNAQAFSHTHSLRLRVSLIYLPPVLESCEHGGYGHGL